MIHALRGFCAASLMLLAAGCGTPADIQKVAEPAVRPIAEGGQAKPVQFRRMVVKLNRGQHIGAVQSGLLCIPHGDLLWRGGRVGVSDEEFTEAFREELRKANYPIVGDPNALFEDPDSWKAEILIAGLITDIKANVCFPWAGYGNFTTAGGEGSMTVEWQIYSRLDRQVIHRLKTSGASAVPSSPVGSQDIFYVAFAQATRGLLADARFHEIVSGAANTAAPAARVEALSLRGVPLGRSSLGARIGEKQASVVTIFAGDGHGSGFVISPDGYILTNSHVVENARYVKVKLTTTREVVGEVLRSDRRRDVALVRIAEPGLPALAIASVEPAVGDEVHAIGSPFSPRFQGTVTRGIVSGYRADSELRLIQSDVTVHPGNSGGPLIDRMGNVVGITATGMRVGSANTGLNFFVPIMEALRALQVQMAGAPSS